MAVNTKIKTVDVSSASYAARTTVVGQADVPGLTAQEMQTSVEYMPRNLLAPKINELVNAVNASYSKAETDAAINAKVAELGTGDMAQADYDANGNVKKAGGIAAFVNSKVSSLTALNTFMNETQGVDVTVKNNANGSNWVQHDDGSWWQNVKVTGVTADMIAGTPTAFVADDKTDNTDGHITELARQLGLIKLIRTNKDSIDFVCPDELPTFAMRLRIPMISLRG